MSKMFRLNVDGTVDVCDDTPDVDIRVKKYQKSAMHEDQWIFIYWHNFDLRWSREYIDKSEVPNVIKMFNLLDP